MTSGKDRFLSDAIGTLRSFWRIGTVRLKDASGVLQVRNAADGADANLKAAAIQLSASPGTGKVLTSDASGNGSWNDVGDGSSPVVYSPVYQFSPRAFAGGNFAAPVVNTACYWNQYCLMSGLNAEVSIDLPMTGGHWNLEIAGLKSNVSGDITVSIDGSSTGANAGYNATSIVWFVAVDLGTLTAGVHTIDLKITGKQPSSGGYNFYCSYIALGIV